MGVTKQYLRFVHQKSFGVINGPKCASIHIRLRGFDGYLVSPSCENVIIWDVRKREPYYILRGESTEVSMLAADPHYKYLAVGYSNGLIQIFSIPGFEKCVSFSGHDIEITSLSFDSNGMRLVSGSKDTDLIVWDIVSETGLFRLKGHKGPITRCIFVPDKNILISSSKDTYVKFWDLDTQHCFYTLVGHKTEIWDLLLISDYWLITGSTDSELRVWSLQWLNGEEEKPKIEFEKLLDTDEDNLNEAQNLLRCKKVGSLLRGSQARVSSLATDAENRLLVCHGKENMLELFYILNSSEQEKKLKKKTKKARKEGENDVDITLTLCDQVKRLKTVRTKGKICGISVVKIGPQIYKIFCSLMNNQIEWIDVNIEDKLSESKSSCIDLFGHRSDIRTVCFSSDSYALLTGSAESLKVWNRLSGLCTRTIPCGFSLCSLFAPGDRHAVVGCKSGALELFDLNVGEMCESIEAHSGAIWSLCAIPDQTGFISGSADKTAKVWYYELVGEGDSKQLSVVHSKTLQLEEDILCVRISPNKRLLAVSLIDCTVQVFFFDTLKFFLSLYGHKLPVLSMEISGDSTLLVTGSGDRNIKIWGLDFGDCHKSLFGHEDSIVGVKFIPKTHLFFTCGKDRKVKQWDADNFQRIITLEGHLSEIWGIDVSPNGLYLVSVGHDKSVRLWEKTDEPLVLQEEREIEREEEDEKRTSSEQHVITKEFNKEADFALKRTVASEEGAERLMEALDIYEAYFLERRQGSKNVELHPLMTAFKTSDPNIFLVLILNKIRLSIIDSVLLVLPYSYVQKLLVAIYSVIKNNKDDEACLRALIFLIRIHHSQITTDSVLTPIVGDLKKRVLSRIEMYKDTAGFAIGALTYIKERVEKESEVKLFVDATTKFKEKRKRKRKLEAIAKKALLSV